MEAEENKRSQHDTDEEQLEKDVGWCNFTSKRIKKRKAGNS